MSHETAGFLGRLETSRELSDYAAAATFSEDQAREELQQAELFIAACRPFVGDAGAGIS